MGSERAYRVSIGSYGVLWGLRGFIGSLWGSIGSERVYKVLTGFYRVFMGSLWDLRGFIGSL